MATTDTSVSCATSLKDVWYSFTTDSTGGFYVLDTEGSAQIDPVLAVFSACGGTQLGCDDDSGTGRQSRIGIALSGNTNIKVRLASFSSEPNGGGYHLNVAKVAAGACCPHLASACRISDSVGCTDGVYSGNGTTCQPDPCPPVGACTFGPCCFQSRASGCTQVWTSGMVCTPGPCLDTPVNDLCVNALPITLGVPVTGCNCRSTTDSTASCHVSGNDDWYTFTAGPAGGVYEVFEDPIEFFFPELITIFDGCGGNELACNLGSGFVTPSRVEFPLNPGATVKIRYASVANPAGDSYRLSVSRPPSGACCADSGVCTITRDTACTGGFRGDQTTCQPNTCLGACCNGAACLMVPRGACAGANQTYVGWFTSCTPYSATAPCCRADFNKSGGAPTVQDIFDFLASYFAGEASADTNDSTGNSVQDIFDFLAAYFAGCV